MEGYDHEYENEERLNERTNVLDYDNHWSQPHPPL